MRHRLLVLTVLTCLACGDDAGISDDGSEVDAGGSVDAPPAELDAAIEDDPDASPACGRQLDPGDGRGDPVAAILDDTYFYVADEVPDPSGGPTDIIRVWRYHRERGEAERIADELYEGTITVGHRLLVDADSVYVSWDHSSEGGGGLLRIPKSGAEETMVTRDGIDSFAVDETHVFWATTRIGTEFEPTIKRRAKAGGDEEILLQTDLSFDTQLVLAGDDILFNDSGLTLRRMPKAGGAVELVGQLTPSCGAPCIDALLVADDGLLYWSSGQNSAGERRVFRSPIDPFERQPIATEPSAILFREELFVVGGGVYWRVSSVESATPGIRRVSVEGGEPITLQVPDSFAAWAPSTGGLYTVSPYNGVWVVPEDCPE
jgi:hypothetical protein